MGIDRLAKLQRMLKARTQGGEPLKNYGDNVAAIRAEIARLETPPPAKRVRKK
jgi:hypothetical protein